MRNGLACQPGLHTLSVHWKSCTAQNERILKKSKQKPKAPPNISPKLQTGHDKSVWKHSAGSSLSPTNHIHLVRVENYFQALLHAVAIILPNKIYFPNYHCTGEGWGQGLCKRICLLKKKLFQKDLTNLCVPPCIWVLL